MINSVNYLILKEIVSNIRKYLNIELLSEFNIINIYIYAVRELCRNLIRYNFIRPENINKKYYNLFYCAKYKNKKTYTVENNINIIKLFNQIFESLFISELKSSVFNIIIRVMLQIYLKRYITQLIIPDLFIELIKEFVYYIISMLRITKNKIKLVEFLFRCTTLILPEFFNIIIESSINATFIFSKSFNFIFIIYTSIFFLIVESFIIKKINK